jgi:hypothetical protein
LRKPISRINVSYTSRDHLKVRRTSGFSSLIVTLTLFNPILRSSQARRGSSAVRGGLMTGSGLNWVEIPQLSISQRSSVS